MIWGIASLLSFRPLAISLSCSVACLQPTCKHWLPSHCLFINMSLPSLRALENGTNYTVFRVDQKVCVMHLHFRYYYYFTFTDRFGEVVYMFKCAWPSCHVRGRVRRRIFVVTDYRLQHTCPYSWAGILLSWNIHSDLNSCVLKINLLLSQPHVFHFILV